MRYDLVVVVVSYNTAGLLRTCLGSLQASLTRSMDRCRSRVIVVDNASPDGSAQLVRDEFSFARLLALDENRGFAAANNLALRDADARYVLLLNPDTEILGDAPAALARFMDEHPTAGACGGRLLNPDLTFQHSCFHFPTLPMSLVDFFPFNHRIVNSHLNGRYPRRWYNDPFQIDHPLGACLMVRQETIQQVGMMDEGFFMYCEEVDWCYRIKQAGWEIWYTPDAEVIHHGASSTSQYAGPMLVELHRSRDRFFRKHYGPLFAETARAILRLGMAAAARRVRRAATAGQIDQATREQQLAIYRAACEW
ncbi:MAG TPA: glycosyltransferase family 2 protein [Chloroflexota bacterium]|nr:glycosyltransferase family 2 protein [Chloroflexota bacterium]